MSNGLKLLLMAAGAIITCIIVVVGFNITQSGQVSVKEAQEQVGIEFNLLKDYDNRPISGSAVIDLIKKYEDEALYFQVKTNASTTTQGVYYNRDESLSVAGTYNSDLLKTNPDYIKPEALFNCTVKLNNNEIVIGLKFVQR